MSPRTVSAEEAVLIVRKLRATRPIDPVAAGIMRKDQAMARRSYGSGSLFQKGSAWYGQWRVSGRLVKRKIGPMRQPGTREGLTRAQAERELQRRIEQETVVIARHSRTTVESAGERYLHHLEHVMQRATSTIQDYGISSGTSAPTSTVRRSIASSLTTSWVTWLSSAVLACRRRRSRTT
jgi:hypothetical protein